MRIGKIIEMTYAEGPGCRFCIWVQGCNHKCKGCFAEDLWDYNLGVETAISDIISRIDNVKDKIEGITFLGGEPFDKAGELYLIAKYVQSIDKNVITFTGYTFEQIKLSDNSAWKKLLEYTDLLIDGEFKQELLDYSRPLVGSSNQNFVFLTDKISKTEIDNYKNRFEIRYEDNGKISFNGMGNIEKLKKYINKL